MKKNNCLLLVGLAILVLSVGCGRNSSDRSPQPSYLQVHLKEAHRPDLIRTKNGTIYFIVSVAPAGEFVTLQACIECGSSYWNIARLEEIDARIIRSSDTDYDPALRQFANQTQ